MAEQFDFKQSSDLNPALLNPEAKTFDAHKLTGRWLNTNPETKGLAEFVIEQDGERFSVSALGVGPDGPLAWPVARAKPLANLEEEAGQRTLALTATFDLGFMKSETQIRVNKGVLVVVLFNTFLDDSGRSSYVNREFFYRREM